MKIDINFLEGMQIEALFGKFKITSDQNKKSGGNEEYPEPFDYFLASTVLCSAFYIRSFCNARNISTDGIVISQVNKKEADNKYKQTFEVTVKLPEDFPQKYKKALLTSAENCTIKKVIENGPNFLVTVE